MKNLKVIFEYIVEVILLCVMAYIICPPKVLVGEPNFHGNEFISGVMQGIMSLFGWFISLFGVERTGYPHYIQNGEYWHGYWLGVGIFAGGCYYQVLKLYTHKLKSQNGGKGN